MSLLRRILSASWYRNIDYAPTENIDWRDEWVESEHPRVPSGTPAGGQFLGGNVPTPGTIHVGKQGNAKKLAQQVSEHLAKGGSSKEIAQTLKQYGANYSYAGYASYANQLLAHVEAAYNLKPGSLGKATAKPKIKGTEEPPEPGPPSEAEIEAMAQEPEGEITPALGPISPAQQQMTEIINSDWPDAEKANWIEALAKDIPEGDTEGQMFASAWAHKLKGGGEADPLAGAKAINAKAESEAEDYVAAVGKGQNLTNAEKIMAIKTYIGHKKTYGEIAPGGMAETYANNYIEQLQGQQTKPEDLEKGGGEPKMSDPTDAHQKIVEGVAKSTILSTEQKIDALNGIIGHPDTGHETAYLANEWVNHLQGQQPAAALIEAGGVPLPPVSNTQTATMHKIATDPALSDGQKIEALKQTWATTEEANQYLSDLIEHIMPQPTDIDSTTQKEMYEAALAEGWQHATKISQLKSDIANAATPEDKEYGQKLLTHLEGQQPAVAAPTQPAAIPDPPPSAMAKEMHQIATDPHLSTEAKIAAINEKIPAAKMTSQYQAKVLAALKGEAPAAAPAAAPAIAIDPPNPHSGVQKSIHNYVTSAHGTEGKISAIKTLMEINKLAPKSDHEYAEKALEALGEKPAEKPQPPPADLTAPAAGSTTQTQMHNIASKPATANLTNTEKIASIKKLLANSGGSTGGKAETYANELIAKLGGQPTTVEAAKAEQVPAQAPGAGGASATPGKAAKPTLAQQAAAAAPATAPHGSLTAPANTKVTQARKSPALSFALKTEADAAKPPSTSSGESYGIVPSLESGFWQKVSHSKDAQAFESYGGGGYHEINGTLRGKTTPTKDALDKIDAMQALMNEPEVKITQDLRLTRGEVMSQADIAAIKTALEKGVGTHHYLRTGFTSASIGPTPGYRADANTWWHFQARTGSKVLGIAGKIGHHEREVILPHGVAVEIYEMYEETTHHGKHMVIKATYG